MDNIFKSILARFIVWNASVLKKEYGSMPEIHNAHLSYVIPNISKATFNCV